MKSWIGISPIALFLAAAAPGAVPTGQPAGGVAAAASQPTDILPGLSWKAAGGAAMKPVLSTHGDPAEAGLASPPGFAVHAVHIATFPTGGAYSASLPGDATGEGTFVTFGLLNCGSAEDPGQGTTVTVAGATIGFGLQRARPGTRPTVRLMVLGLGADGNRKWIPANVVILPRANGSVSLYDISVRLHPASGTWDLYMQNTARLKGLPLMPGPGSTGPEIALRTGNAGGPVGLRGLEAGSAPATGAHFPVDRNGYFKAPTK